MIIIKYNKNDKFLNQKLSINNHFKLNNFY